MDVEYLKMCKMYDSMNKNTDASKRNEEVYEREKANK